MNQDLSEDAQRLFNLVPTSGAGIGNTTLIRQLGWPEERYWRVRNELLDKALVRTGQGRGGAIRRTSIESNGAAGVAPGIPVDDDLAIDEVIRGREADLYPDIRNVIEGAFARDRRLNHVLVHVTASQGRRATGGRWSRPDIVSVSITKYLHLPSRVLDLTTFEVKAEGAVDVSAVYEALSHRRSATRSYVIFHVPTETEELTATLGDICDEARNHGIGVIVVGNPTDYSTWDERVQAERHDPDPARLDRFITEQLGGFSNLIAREIH